MLQMVSPRLEIEDNIGLRLRVSERVVRSYRGIPANLTRAKSACANVLLNWLHKQRRLADRTEVGKWGEGSGGGSVQEMRDEG